LEVRVLPAPPKKKYFNVSDGARAGISTDGSKTERRIASAFTAKAGVTTITMLRAKFGASAALAAIRNVFTVTQANQQRLYFRPGQLDYARVDMSKPGKRWFCTEQDAQAAGWRPAAR
jgi:hypothetical protein